MKNIVFFSSLHIPTVPLCKDSGGFNCIIASFCSMKQLTRSIAAYAGPDCGRS